MVEARSRDSCRECFKMLVLLPLMAQHTYTVTVFLVSNKEYLNVGIITFNGSTHIHCDRVPCQ